MILPSAVKVILLLWVSAHVSFAQAISSCPVQEISYSATDGSLWAICPNSDYQTGSTQILNSVKSNTACAQLCQQYNNGACKNAVYDKTNFICHLKGSATGWVTSAYYDSIRFVSKPTVGSTVTSCPVGEYNVTSSDGAQWAVCPLTDYAGNTLQAIPQVTSETACATSCSNSAGCSRAVYDAKNLNCYLKDGTQNTWTFNNAYETIRLLYKPQQGDQLTFCPGGDQNLTSQSGRGFAVCNSSDFSGPASTITGNIGTIAACMQQCDQVTGCTKAVYDAKNQVCFIKDSSAPWVFNTNYQTVRLVNGTANNNPTTSNSNRGKWAPAVNLPVVPAGAFVVPEQPVSNRVLGYSSWGPYEFSGPTGITQFADYNWQTGAVSQRTVTETNHDMFCPGMSFLANGTMVVTGGENAEAVSFYNYKTNSWTRAADMKIARGYQSSTTLSDGRVFTIGGSFTGGIGGQDVAPKAGEVYDPATNTWTLLAGCDVVPMLTTFDAEGPWRTDNHAWLYGWKNGYVFQAGPSKSMHWYGTGNGGSVQLAGTRDANNDTMCGVNVMYDAVAGKIFAAGGSQSYTNSPAFTTAHSITIGNPNQPAVVELLAPMNFQRGFANVVVLPNGQVIMTGGQATSLVFTDIQSVFAAELWDPTTKAFTVLAPATIPRNYHSVSLLLADGTVWAAGSGLCPVGQGESTAFCDQTVQHFNGEIFSPPYLFNKDGTSATRPTINALSSNTDAKGFVVRVGGTLKITMNDATGATFSLVRIGSATHSINTDQRRIPLAQVTKTSAVYTVTLPADSGIVIPGYYYLFAMNTAGVPCVARTVQVTL